MGLILCKKHGKQGFYEVCGHIDAEYKQDIYRKHRNFCIGELLGILVCEKCWEKHSLDRFQLYLDMSFDEFLNLDNEKADLIGEEWDEVYCAVGRQGWCIECVAEIIVRQARKNGEPDPFPIYEKTFTQLYQERVDELKKSLTDNFLFQKSIYWESYFQNCPAIFLQSGSFTRPLTIQIYYVTSEIEQNPIIKFIDKFLSQTELNQAKIVFLESENWIRTDNSTGTVSFHRGEEKVLKTVFLNC